MPRRSNQIVKPKANRIVDVKRHNVTIARFVVESARFDSAPGGIGYWLPEERTIWLGTFAFVLEKTGEPLSNVNRSNASNVFVGDRVK